MWIEIVIDLRVDIYIYTLIFSTQKTKKRKKTKKPKK